MTPELTKELIVDSLSVCLTALFTGVPAGLLFWWTWRRDQERLVVQKLFSNWQTITGNWVSEKDQFGPVFGILVRNRSLFSVHVSSVGFEIDGTIIPLETPLFPTKMKRNPVPNTNYPYVADDDSDPREIQSQKSTQVNVGSGDRAKLAGAIFAAAEKHNVSIEDLLKSTRVNALVALETGKEFTSIPFSKRMRLKMRPRLKALMGATKMKTKIAGLVFLSLLVSIGYGGYCKGRSDATAKAAADYNTEYGNDWKDDPSVKHSAIYSLAYTRGSSGGSTETRQQDFMECSKKLARIAVEAGNAKVAGKLLADHEIAPSQLEAAKAQYEQKH